jgi:hypothetical protein
VCREHGLAGLPSEAPCCEHATTAVSRGEWLRRRIATMTLQDRLGGLVILAAHARALGHAFVWKRLRPSRRTEQPTQRLQLPMRRATTEA